MVTALSTMQLKLDFDASITTQFKELEDVVAAVVYGYKGGLGAVAAACDVAPSTLSRMLNRNEDDPRRFPLEYLAPVIEVTKDLRPIHWLVAKFVPDPQARRDAAMATLVSLLPQIVSIVEEVKGGVK